MYVEINDIEVKESFNNMYLDFKYSDNNEVIEVKEDQMDAVTAVSGSGPAYFFLFTDILEKGAKELGLKSDLANKLALQTFIGASGIAEKSGLSMHDFIKNVASKGGTTEAALKVFRKRKLEKIVIEAVKAARDRSREFSESINTKS